MFSVCACVCVCVRVFGMYVGVTCVRRSLVRILYVYVVFRVYVRACFLRLCVCIYLCACFVPLCACFVSGFVCSCKSVSRE